MKPRIVFRTRASLATRSAAIVAVMAMGLAACSLVDSPDADSPSSVSPDEGKASAALDAGLEAHAAGDLTGAAVNYKETLKYDPKTQ